VRWIALAAIAVAFLSVPPLAGVPGRLIAGCPTWIALAAALELLSILGFIAIFKLIFDPRGSWRESSGAALRALGAATVLPAGGLVGPVMGAHSMRTKSDSRSELMRSAIAFAVITNVPGVIVLGALSLILWLGWLDGPHDAALTLPPAALAFAVLAVGLLTRRPPRSDQRRAHRARLPDAAARQIAAALSAVCDGIQAGWRLLVAANWKVAGAVAYYAFDNAVLWAAFRAYGPTPPLSVIIMGYLVGSLSTALPLPAGIGVVEGGLIGALVLYGAPAGPAAGAVLLYRGLSLSLPVILGTSAWALLPGAKLRLEIARSRRNRARAPLAARRTPRPGAASADRYL
jgi:uncharacterized membrane protein YbhN (UPF0104 family)